MVGRLRAHALNPPRHCAAPLTRPLRCGKPSRVDPRSERGRARARRRTVRSADPERDRLRELEAWLSRIRVGREWRRRPVDPGLRDRYQRRPGPDGQLQDRYHIDQLPDRHLSAWLLRRAWRAQGRNHRDCGHHGDRSAGLHDHRRHHQRQPGRLRQLERVGFMVGAKRCGLRYLPRTADPPGRGRRPGEPYRVHRPRR